MLVGMHVEDIILNLSLCCYGPARLQSANGLFGRRVTAVIGPLSMSSGRSDAYTATGVTPLSRHARLVTRYAHYYHPTIRSIWPDTKFTV